MFISSSHGVKLDISKSICGYVAPTLASHGGGMNSSIRKWISLSEAKDDSTTRGRARSVALELSKMGRK